MALEQRTSPFEDERISAFGLMVEANRRLNRAIGASLKEQHDLTEVTFEALLRLGRSPEHHLSMSELADQMVLTSGGVTRLVDRLAADGYMERVPCPTDRRVQWARLTDEGLAKISAALETHLEDLEELFASRLSAAELEVLTAVMDRLRQ
jgi:DNA-binding MarR family transcriptional regulator